LLSGSGPPHDALKTEVWRLAPGLIAGDGNARATLAVVPFGSAPSAPAYLSKRPAVEDKIRATIEAIRPAVQADGGDIFLRNVDVETGVVTVELVGACVSCPASTLTLKAGVERILKDRVEGVTAVEALGTESESAVSL